MEYITSRGFRLPGQESDLENSDWFNMWKTKKFPYKELLIGDILYWYDSTQGAIIWKTKIKDIIRFPYENKQEIIDKFEYVSKDPYFQTKEDRGFFISYKVNVIKKVSIPKPNNFRFNNLGWEKVEGEIALDWFNEQVIEETNILDNIISNNTVSLNQQLLELNDKIRYVSPERVEKIVASTIRHDSQLIKTLKQIAEYRCQFPNCGKRIRKKGGGYYAEVAHIRPVSGGGLSVLGNLLVLCPNHIKEFDFGDLRIEEQSSSKLKGELNGVKFNIDLIK